MYNVDVDITILHELIHNRSVPECGSETLKCQQAPAHIWDMSTMKSVNIYLLVCFYQRLFSSQLLQNDIIDYRYRNNIDLNIL